MEKQSVKHNQPIFFSDLKAEITNLGPHPAWITDRHGKKLYLPVGESLVAEGPAEGRGDGGETDLQVVLET